MAVCGADSHGESVLLPVSGGVVREKELAQEPERTDAGAPQDRMQEKHCICIRNLLPKQQGPKAPLCLECITN